MKANNYLNSLRWEENISLGQKKKRLGKAILYDPKIFYSDINHHTVSV